MNYFSETKQQQHFSDFWCWLFPSWRLTSWNLLTPFETWQTIVSRIKHPTAGERKRQRRWKVDRVLANQSLLLTAGTPSNIPFAWFLVLGCNRQAERLVNQTSQQWRSILSWRIATCLCVLLSNERFYDKWYMKGQQQTPETKRQLHWRLTFRGFFLTDAGTLVTRSW